MYLSSCSRFSYFEFIFIAEKSGGLNPKGRRLECMFLYLYTFGVLSKISLFVLEISGMALLLFFFVFIDYYFVNSVTFFYTSF